MKKKYKQKYKSKRQDYRKGGRVQKAKGGVNTRRAEPDDRLNKTIKPPKRTAQPIKKPVRDLSDPSGKTLFDPKDVPNMKVGNQQPRNTQPAPPVENRAKASIPTGPVKINK